MAQQEGPFSEYLQMAKMTPQVQVPQPTGLEGAGSAIGNIAMNFINGLRQGRIQKYAMQQMEEQKKFDAYQDTLQKVRASRLPQAEKERLEAQLTMPLVQRIAGDKEASSKATGNPLTDVLKNMAVGLVGGNIPKKGADLPMDPIVEALRMVSDPEKSVDRLASAIDSKVLARVAQLNKESLSRGRRLTFDQIESDPEYRGYLQEARQLGVPLPSERLISARYPMLGQSEIELRRKTEAAEQARQGYRARQQRLTGAPEALGQEGAAVAAAPVPSTAATQVTATAPIPTGAIKRTPDLAGRRIVNEYDLNKAFSEAKAGDLEGAEWRGNPQLFVDDQSGQTFMGYDIKSETYGAGTYNPATKELIISGVRPATSADTRKPSPDHINKVTKSSIQDLIIAVGEEFAAPYIRSIEARSQLGTPESLAEMPRIIDRAISAKAAKNTFDLVQSIKRDKGEDALTAKQNESIFKVHKEFISDQRVKDFNTASTYSLAVDGALKRAQQSGNYSDADRLLVRNLAKLTDITTGVREGEYETFASAVGKIAQHFKIPIGNLWSGKGEILTPEIRQKFIDDINDIKSGLKDKSKEAAEDARELGRVIGLDDDILSRITRERSISITPGGTTPPPSTGGGSRVPTRDEGASRGGGKGKTEREAPTL